MACRKPSRWPKRSPTSSATAAICPSSLASISRMSGVVGSRRALISVSCIPFPNPVSRISAPCSWARRATVKAMLCGESTPVIRSLRLSRSTAGYYLSGFVNLHASGPTERGRMPSSGLDPQPVSLLVTPALLAVTGTVNGAYLALTAPWPRCVARSAPILLGATEAGRVNVDPRLQDITLHSQAMRGDVHVDVLTPTGYDPSSGMRYPVLYLLHGALGTYKDWPANGVEALVGDTPVIVVMPDDGRDGSYSDWYGSGVLELRQPPRGDS